MDIITDLALPCLDTCGSSVVVHQAVCRIRYPQELILVDLSEIIEFHEPFDQDSLISPFVRIMPSRIGLCATYMAGTQGVVVVVRYEEELVVLRTVGVEIDIEIVGIVPMIIPHSYSYIDRIGLQEKFYIADPLDPFVEILVVELAHVQDEILQLGCSFFECAFVLLELIWIIPVRVVWSDFSVAYALEIGSHNAFPEVSFVASELRHSSFYVVVVSSFQHVVHSVIGWLRVSFHMHPDTAIHVLKGSPDAGTAEQVIAEKLPYMRRVFLEPFEVEFAHSLDFMVIIFDELPEIQTEMAFMPVCVIRLMHLAVVSFRTHA